MSLKKQCDNCGERISLRRMPHGKYVPFDFNTRNRHQCGRVAATKAKPVTPTVPRASTPPSAPAAERRHPTPRPTTNQPAGKGEQNSWSMAIIALLVIIIVILLTRH